MAPLSVAKPRLYSKKISGSLRSGFSPPFNDRAGEKLLGKPRESVSVLSSLRVPKASGVEGFRTPPPIDLRSDTMTRPTGPMLEAICKAEVGDDCYGEDPTVKALEERCASFFGKQRALFMPSGTMSNQVAIRALTSPGDEVLCDRSYHVNFFESSPTSALAGVNLNLLQSVDGVITAKMLDEAIDSKARWDDKYAKPKLLIVENTVNTHGGRIFPIHVLRELRSRAKQHGVSIHLDGARLLNACVASGVRPEEYASYVDSLTMCFAKGLGAPFGSILLGDERFIENAVKYRKWYGGALHQAGYMASAALFAIDNHVERLADDHRNALLLADEIRRKCGLPVECETNMMMIDTEKLGVTAEEFVNIAKIFGIKLIAWSEYKVRAVTHLGVSEKDISTAGDRIQDVFRYISVERFRKAS